MREYQFRSMPRPLRAIASGEGFVEGLLRRRERRLSNRLLRGNSLRVVTLRLFNGLPSKLQLLAGKPVTSDVCEEHQSSENRDSGISPMWTIIRHN